MNRPNNASEYRKRGSRLPEISLDGPICTIKDLRWTRFPDPPKGRVVEWHDKTFDIRELTNVYLAVNWWTRVQAFAHTMLCFEFSDGQVITASAEIRPRVGESFGLLKGLRKTFEVYFSWSTESDALLSRAYLNERVHLLEAVISHQAALRLFNACVQRTQELHRDDVEWYHTVRNSCTTNIFDIAAQAVSDRFDRPAWRNVPGYAPRYLAKHGALKMQGDYKQTLAATDVSDRIREIGDVDDFSQQLRSRS